MDQDSKTADDKIPGRRGSRARRLSAITTGVIILIYQHYDVLDGTYEIEPLGTDRCRLHLTSNHRLSTRFNAYAAWWSMKIMDQIQGSILEVIRSRAVARG